ncbi:MAG TPA: response regulator [Candidatus Dormibacteraeota bacterium]|nr:response regulator [Candidatus Dormibacteraeota bacterium]
MSGRVLIVDDHAGFRHVARQLVEQIGRVVVGEAETGKEALTKARRLKPDIVLLDIQLPDVDGLAVSASLTSDATSPVVVLVSTRGASDYGPRLDGCGALGFIAKADLTAESLRALLEA